MIRYASYLLTSMTVFRPTLPPSMTCGCGTISRLTMIDVRFRVERTKRQVAVRVINLSLMCEANGAGLTRSCKTIGPVART